MAPDLGVVVDVAALGIAAFLTLRLVTHLDPSSSDRSKATKANKAALTARLLKGKEVTLRLDPSCTTPATSAAPSSPGPWLEPAPNPNLTLTQCTTLSCATTRVTQTQS